MSKLVKIAETKEVAPGTGKVVEAEVPWAFLRARLEATLGLLLPA